MSTETRRFARRPAGPARGSIAGEWTSPALGSVPLTGWSLWEEWESDPTAGAGSSPLTTKGDVYTYSTADARLAVGTDGWVLTADSAQATGIKWAAAGGISDGDKGDITVSASGATWTIDNDVVTYAKMQNVSATDRLLGRSSIGAGDVEEIACTAAGRAILDDADATAQRTTLGLVAIASSGSASDLSAGTVPTARLGSGTADGTTFLRGDQTWAAPTGGSGASQAQVAARLALGGF